MDRVEEGDQSKKAEHADYGTEARFDCSRAFLRFRARERRHLVQIPDLFYGTKTSVQQQC
jgi:hypothetical protein